MLQRADAQLLQVVAACSLVVIPYAHYFYFLPFTTLFAINMNFEYLSILKTGQALLSLVVEVSDLPLYEKYHLSSIKHKSAFAR